MFKGQSDLCTLSTNSIKHLYKYLTSSGKQFCWSPSVAWSVWQEAHTQSCVCDKWNPNPATHGSTSVHTPNTDPDLQTGCWDYKWLTSSSQEFPSVLLKYSCACFHRSTFICIYINIHRSSSSPDKGRFITICFALVLSISVIRSQQEILQALCQLQHLTQSWHPLFHVQFYPMLRE